jgi:hypothetical protein
MNDMKTIAIWIGIWIGILTGVVTYLLIANVNIVKNEDVCTQELNTYICWEAQLEEWKTYNIKKIYIKELWN